MYTEKQCVYKYVCLYILCVYLSSVAQAVAGSQVKSLLRVLWGPAFMFREFKILGILGYVKFNRKFSNDLLLGLSKSAIGTIVLCTMGTMGV